MQLYNSRITGLTKVSTHGAFQWHMFSSCTFTLASLSDGTRGKVTELATLHLAEGKDSEVKKQ